MRRGVISYSKVRAVTRVATAATEQALLDVALCGTAAHVEQIVRGWRRVDRIAEQAGDRRRHEARSLRTWVDDDGMVVVRGRLTPEVGAVLRRVLEAACDQARGQASGGSDPGAGTAADEAAGQLAPSFAQRQADAMGVVAECALAGGLDRGTAGDRYQVVVHVDADALADEPDVPAGTCQGDASDRVRVAAGGNCRSAAGQSVRRRGGCSSYTTGAHSQTVLEEAGGIHVSPETARRLSCDATALDNLVLLCRRHHRAVHEEGFRVTLDTDGDVQFVRPDGRPFPAVPPAPNWTGAPLAPVTARLDQDDIAIDPHTATPAWRGERLDLHWAVGVLWRPRPDTQGNSG